MVVIGVHSSKFSNEKSKSNILNATKRHLLKHPIACDFDLKIWTSLEIICWPTFLVVNPDGLIIAEFQGEMQTNLIKQFLNISFKFYADKLNKIKLDFGLSDNENFLNLSRKKNLNSLSFPTKIYYDSADNSLFISDSGNNRILVVEANSGEIKFTIGNGRQGYADSSFSECEFDCPQGLFYDKETKNLFIADTFNDLIRVADLETLQVRTLCGIPNKLNKSVIRDYDYIGGKKALEQHISSPWDLCLINKENSKVLLIACAGTHQIWLFSFENKVMSSKYDLNCLSWWKTLKFSWETLNCVAGNGKERNKNNSYPLQASFAQPSGLCLDIDGQNVYISDAESSTIRLLNLKDGSVKGLVGGDHLQPDNLFAYGDVDGKGSEAKLQHPLDVRYYFNPTQSEKHYLLVADTYNNSIRKIEIEAKMCKKLNLIDNEDSNLNEPSGLCVDQDRNRIWIIDTNNHSIKLVQNFDINSSEFKLKEFKIQFANDCIDSFSSLSKQLVLNKKNDLVRVRFNCELNKSAENVWKLKIIDDKDSVNENIGKFDKSKSAEDSNHLLKGLEYCIGLDESVGSIESISSINHLELSISVFYCGKDSNNSSLEVCKILKRKFQFQKMKFRIQ